MAITYPLNVPGFPDSIGKFRWGLRTATLATESPHSFVQQIQVLQGKMWLAEFTPIPLKGAAAAEEWIAFLISLNGRQGTFLLGDPFRVAPRGSAAGTPVLDGAGQTGTTINTRGWTPNESGVLLYGDNFQVGNSGNTQRLYKVLQQVDADANGDAAVEVWPNLRDAPADGASIITSNPKGTFRMVSSENNYDWATGEITSISISAGEAI